MSRTIRASSSWQRLATGSPKLTRGWRAPAQPSPIRDPHRRRKRRSPPYREPTDRPAHRKRCGHQGVGPAGPDGQRLGRHIGIRGAGRTWKASTQEALRLNRKMCKAPPQVHCPIYGASRLRPRPCEYRTAIRPHAEPETAHNTRPLHASEVSHLPVGEPSPSLNGYQPIEGRALRREEA